MHLARRHFALMSITAAWLAACGQAPQGQGMGGFPPPEVTTLTAKAADVPIDFEYNGQLAGSREVEIRPRISGVIAQRAYTEGSQVKAGQLLFRLDADTYAAEVAAAEAGMASAQARLKQVEREYTRIKTLVEAQAQSQKTLDDADAERDLAAAGLKAAKARLDSARLNLAYTEIKAPISGIIGRALKVEGSLVGPSTDNLLATMAQLDPIHVHFGIPENEQARIQQDIASGSLKLAGRDFIVRLQTADGQPLPRSGRINFRDYRADANTGSYIVRAAFDNAGHRLHPGQLVRVRLTGAVRPQVIALPQRAVLDGPTGKFVYVLGKGKDQMPIAEPRPVVTGEWVRLGGAEKNAWIVKQGLKAGDQVIVDGVAKIMMPGMPVKPTH